MKVRKLTEDLLYQSLLKAGDGLDAREKLNLICLDYLSRLNLDGYPDTVQRMFTELKELISMVDATDQAADNPWTQTHSGLPPWHGQFMFLLLEIYSEILSWNQLQEFIQAPDCGAKTISVMH